MKRSLAILFLLPLSTFAQDPNHSTMLNSAAFINPAMAATDTMDLATIKYRNQWPAITANYITTSTYYSHYSSVLNSATYVIGSHDAAGGGIIKTTNVGLGYAQKIKLGDHFLIQVAGEAVYFQKSIDWTKLTFGDMIDPATGHVFSSGSTPSGGTASGLDFSTGLTFSYKSAFIGFSGHHLNQPDQSLFAGTSPLPAKLGVQMGYEMIISRKWFLTPIVFYQQQSNFNQLNLTLLARFKRILIGGGYRTQDAVIGTIGYTGDRISAYYTYDSTISRLGSGTGGAHELSFSYRIWKKAPHANYLEFKPCGL